MSYSTTVALEPFLKFFPGHANEDSFVLLPFSLSPVEIAKVILFLRDSSFV